MSRITIPSWLMALLLIFAYSPMGFAAKAKSAKAKAPVAKSASAKAKKISRKTAKVTKSKASKSHRAVAQKKSRPGKSSVRSVSSAPGGQQQPLEVKGQARQLSMMLVLKNEREQINFVQLRTDYKNEIPTTEF